MLAETIALTAFLILAVAGLGLSIVSIGGPFLPVLGALLYDLITWSFTITPATLALITALALVADSTELLFTRKTIRTLFLNTLLDTLSITRAWKTATHALQGRALIATLKVAIVFTQAWLVLRSLPL